MKSHVRSTATLRSTAAAPAFYTYLKPGALAQIRYSKISAKTKAIDAQTLIALCQLERSSDPSPPVRNAMETVPCFNLRVKSNYPRCLQRKKLIAITPFFPQPQS